MAAHGGYPLHGTADGAAVKAVPVVPVSLPLHWKQVVPLVERALRKTKADLSPAQIKRHIEQGTMQLWLAWDETLRGICVTELVDSPRGRYCNFVVVAGGNCAAWAHLEGDVGAWAKAQRCVRLRFEGRHGWTRKFADNWRRTAVVMEREL